MELRSAIVQKEVRRRVLVLRPRQEPASEVAAPDEHDLAVPGSLKRLQLPRTLSDALQLAELLGFRYLWFDVLYIVQHDTAEPVYQISRLAAVYLNASLAVAAAACLDCEAGLPDFDRAPASAGNKKLSW